MKLKFQTVAEKTVKNFRGLLYFVAPGRILQRRVSNPSERGTGGRAPREKESFTDLLDFADDVALLAEMLSVLVLALEVMDREAHPLGLTINWAKTKIQNLGDLDEVNQMHYATVQGNQAEVVESFTYLGSLIHCSGNS